MKNNNNGALAASSRAVAFCVALAASATLAIGCGGDSDSTDTGAASPAAEEASAAPAGAAERAEAVTIADFKYDPPTVTVQAGGRITWSNTDSAPHTATAKQGDAFNTDTLDQGQSKEITFPKVGKFKYFCVFHPFMKGTVEVIG